MNFKKYVKLALFLSVCAFAPVKGMQSRKLEAYAQFLRYRQQHSYLQEKFVHHIDKSEYCDALALIKTVPPSFVHEYIKIIESRLISLNYDPCAAGFIDSVIRLFPLAGTALVNATCCMEQDEERAQIALMLAGAYANMDLVSKAALHEKLALYIYPIKDRHSFFVAACINDHEAMKIYRCDLIDNNKKVGYTIFKIYPGSCSAHIDYVHVSDKSVRGKGVGTALLRFTLETLKKLGCKEVALYADPYDSDRTFTESELQQKLLSFYARHGFWSKDGSRTLVHDFTKNISYAPKAKL